MRGDGAPGGAQSCSRLRREARPSPGRARLPALRRGVLAGATWLFPLAPDRACECGAIRAPHRPAGSQRTARSGRRAGLRGPPSIRLTLSRIRRVAASRSIRRTSPEDALARAGRAEYKAAGIDVEKDLKEFLFEKRVSRLEHGAAHRNCCVGKPALARHPRPRRRRRAPHARRDRARRHGRSRERSPSRPRSSCPVLRGAYPGEGR
jgi:hypothetical protein